MLSNRIIPSVCALVCLLALCCAGCRSGRQASRASTPEPMPPPPNILFITVDALRADYTGSIGNKPFTHTMDEIAAQGVVFTRCISAASVTGPSVAAMMTGIMPHRINYQFNAVPLDPGLFTLPEILNFAGYETAGFPGTSLLSSDYGFNQGFDVFEDSFNRSEKATNHWRPAEPVTDAVLKWLDTRDAAKPFFAWIHYFDPHDPYTAHYGERAGQEFTHDYLYDLYLKQDPERIKKELPDIIEFYSQDVFYADQAISRIMKRLQDNRLISNTLVVIVADHGEELFQHDLYHGHGRTLYDAVLHVPLIIMFPAKQYAGTRVTGVTRTIDILPTILEQAGRGIPANVQGQSLLPLITGREKESRPAYSIREPLAFYSNGKAASLTESEWKYIHFTREPGRLYNLKRDPGEFVNVAPDHPEVAERMRKAILKNTLDDPGYIPPVEPELSGRDFRALKDLGYIR